MTKSDLIDALAADTGLTKADADRFLKSFTSNVEKALKRGDSLTLIGFGTFSVSNRAARLETENVPKPINVSESPLLRAFSTLDVNDFKKRSESAFVRPVSAARASIRSDLVIIFSLFKD